MRPRPLLLSMPALAVAGLALGAGPGGGTVYPDQQGALPPYRKLVDDYRRYGASAVRRAIALSGDEIAAGRHAVAGSWEEQRAAAMLHTEAVLVLLNDREVSRATAHLQAAEELIDEVARAAPEQKDFGYRWYTVTGPLIREFRQSSLANELSRRMEVRFSGPFLSVRRKLESAILFELQGCRDGTVLSAVAPGRTAGVDLLPRWFNPASRQLEEVLEEDPTLLAAALHLGRMQMLLDRLDDASRNFERARGSIDPRARYLATLFLGSLDERAGRLPEAEKRYRDALAGYAWGQAAHLALAQLLSRTGRDAEARKMLLDRFGDLTVRVIEPLWTYMSGPDEDLGARFDELRAEVWR